jgi:hypothetical protein
MTEHFFLYDDQTPGPAVPQVLVDEYSSYRGEAAQIRVGTLDPPTGEGWPEGSDTPTKPGPRDKVFGLRPDGLAETEPGDADRLIAELDAGREPIVWPLK